MSYFEASFRTTNIFSSFLNKSLLDCLLYFIWQVLGKVRIMPDFFNITLHDIFNIYLYQETWADRCRLRNTNPYLLELFCYRSHTACFFISHVVNFSHIIIANCVEKDSNIIDGQVVDLFILIRI